jgi:serine/threonine protein kinase
VFIADAGATRTLAPGETVTMALEAAAQPAGARVVLVAGYVPGRSLQSMIDAGERLDAAAAERLARELLDILDYLHQREKPILHRDLKPSNVIIDAGGRANLIDFGAVASSAGETGSTMIGTLGYFPHEQIMGRALPASDLYALGMTLLVAITGRPPEEQPHDPSTGRSLPPPGLPPRLASFLAAVLQPAPGMRPASARAARMILDGQMAMVTSAGPRVPELPPDRLRRQRWLYRGVAGTSLAGAALLHTVYFNSFSETALVQIAPFWVTPLAFGLAGLWALPRRNALALAAGGAVLGFIGLMLFLYGIFPSL